MAPGFSHPVVPQAPLPTGYPADYASATADLVSDAKHLAAHTEQPALLAEPRVGQA